MRCGLFLNGNTERRPRRGRGSSKGETPSMYGVSALPVSSSAWPAGRPASLLRRVLPQLSEANDVSVRAQFNWAELPVSKERRRRAAEEGRHQAERHCGKSKGKPLRDVLHIRAQGVRVDEKKNWDKQNTQSTTWMPSFRRNRGRNGRQHRTPPAKCRQEPAAARQLLGQTWLGQEGGRGRARPGQHLLISGGCG